MPFDTFQRLIVGNTVLYSLEHELYIFAAL